MKICSLLPSATEIVCALGAMDALVAVTHECDFPREISDLPRITASAIHYEGSTSREIDTHIREAVHRGSSIYHLDQKLLAELQPDLILTQELCDVCAVSYRIVNEAVRNLGSDTPVLSLEPTSLRGILATIEAVGQRIDRTASATDLLKQLHRRIEAVSKATEALQLRPRVLALEWLEPPFLGGHWVPEMIQRAGGLDPVGQPGRPSVETSWDAIAAAAPDVVILMPCGYDLNQTLAECQRQEWPVEWWRLPAVLNDRVFAVDGSAYFNRPGPRIVDGLEILAEILQPALFPPRGRGVSWVQLPQKETQRR